MDALYSSKSMDCFAFVLDMILPAPCGAELFHSTFPLPTARIEPSLILIGINTFSPECAAMAPFLRIISLTSI